MCSPLVTRERGTSGADTVTPFSSSIMVRRRPPRGQRARAARQLWPPLTCLPPPSARQASSRVLKDFGKCLQPSKIRGGNTRPVDSFIDLVGSTPVLGVSSMLKKMNAFQKRTDPLPEIMVKLESTNPTKEPD